MLKKFLCVIISVSMVLSMFGTVAFGASNAYQTNLIQNGGFEDGTTNPWAVAFSPPESTISVVDGVGINGSKALKFDKTTVHWHYIQYNSISLEAGKAYKFTVYMKMDSGVTTAGAYMGVFTNSAWTNIISNISLNDKWKRIDAYYYSPTNQSIHFKLSMDEAKDVYYDNISISETSYMPFSNYSFENGTTAPWTAAGSGTLTASTDANSGKFSLKHSGRTVLNHYAYSEFYTFKANKKYLITLYMKLETEQAATTPAIGLTLKTGGITWPTSVLSPQLNTNWQKVQYKHTPSADTEWAVVVRPNTGTVNYYIDDLSVVEINSNSVTDQNSDFEAGNTGSWAAYDVGTITATSNAARSGNYGLYYSGRTAAWNSVRLYSVPLIAGTDYTVTCYIKLADSTKTATANLSMIDTDTRTLSDTTAVNGLQWTKVTGTYNALSGATAYHLQIRTNNTESFYIDDIKIEKTSNILSGEGKFIAEQVYLTDTNGALLTSLLGNNSIIVKTIIQRNNSEQNKTNLIATLTDSNGIIKNISVSSYNINNNYGYVSAQAELNTSTMAIGDKINVFLFDSLVNIKPLATKIVIMQ